MEIRIIRCEGDNITYEEVEEKQLNFRELEEIKVQLAEAEQKKVEVDNRIAELRAELEEAELVIAKVREQELTKAETPAEEVF